MMATSRPAMSAGTSGGKSALSHAVRSSWRNFCVFTATSCERRGSSEDRRNLGSNRRATLRGLTDHHDSNEGGCSGQKDLDHVVLRRFASTPEIDIVW